MWRRVVIFSLFSVLALYVITAFTVHLTGFTPSDIKDSNLIDSLFIYRFIMYSVLVAAWPFAIPKIINKRFFNIRCHLEEKENPSKAETSYLKNINQYQQEMTIHYTSKNMYIKLVLMLLFIELVVIRQLNFLGI